MSDTPRNTVGTSASHSYHLNSNPLTYTARRNDTLTRYVPLRLSRSTRGSGDVNGTQPPLSPLGKDSSRRFGCGETYASPERQFGCEGWCRNEMLRKASHADVVGWILNQPSMRCTYSIGPGRYPSHRPMMAKILGMGGHATVNASR
jgi:hypothetical protein